MKMKYWRKLTCWQKAVLIVAVLLAAQVVTYFRRAEPIMPRAALRHLSDYVLIEDSNYVVFEGDTWRSMNKSQKKVLRQEVERYVSHIYYSREEVPDSKKHFRKITQSDRQRYEEYKKSGQVSPVRLEKLKQQIDSGRKVVGLRNGLELSWELKNNGPFWMKSRAGWWSGGIGAEYRSDVYLWFFGWWIPVYSQYHEWS